MAIKAFPTAYGAVATTMKMRFYPNNGLGAEGDKILLDNILITKV